MEEIYDIIIVGEGVAGMTSALYATRAGAKVLILEKNAMGGQAALTYEVANYPAFQSISGYELVDAMQKQVKNLGVEVIYSKVESIENGEIKIVHTKDKEYKAKAIILCLGAHPRKLGISNETQFAGKGVSYCAVCDGAFFRKKTVAVVGGGNTAIEDANYLAKIADKVYVLVRKNNLRAQQILVDSLNKNIDNGKVEILYNTEVVNICGENNVEKVVVKNNINENISEIELSGLFVAIGREADTDMVKNIVELDENGYIIVDKNKQTSAKGIFAAGDCTNTVLRQIVTACADGAIAATAATAYARNN